MESKNDDRLGKRLVDAIAPVLHGDDAAAPAAGYHSDGLPAVAAQGEQKGIQLLIVGIDALNQKFLAFGYGGQIHGDLLCDKW